MFLLGRKLHLQECLLLRCVPGKERHLVRTGTGVNFKQKRFILFLNGTEGVGGDLFHVIAPCY